MSATWPADVARRHRAAGHWTDETFPGFLAARAERYADRVAVVGAPAADPRDRVELTYRDLASRAAELAEELARRGVEAGDRVLVQLPNCVEFPIALFATWHLGALPVFALPAHREREIGQFCETTDAAAYLLAGRRWGHDHLALADHVAAGLRTTGQVPPVVVDLETVAPTRESARPAVPSSAEAVAFLQLSGGTTGVPKLIPRTPADYLYSVRESARICGVDDRTVMLVVLPAAHNFPMSSPGILGVLHAGGTVVLAPDPSPRTCFRLIEAERVTMTSLVPPLLHAWLASRRSRFDLSTLARIQVGGARLADSVAARVGPELDAEVQQVFGMAEGLVNYTRLDDPDELVHTTQGRPISPDDEVRVVDEHDHDVPDGVEGTLLTRGPYTIRGYYGGVAADSFTPEGFYRTGDLVTRLPTGHLRVTGRIKDQINRGGEKVSAQEVEDLLLRHPQVHDVAVVAHDDAWSGERICAYVVPAGPAPDLPALREHLRALGLAGFKMPDQVQHLDAFPATGVGKTSKRDLRLLLAAGPPS